jgi:hypothetical protein
LRPKYNAIDPSDFPEVPLGPRTENLAGQTFGRLTVVHHVGRSRHWQAQWLCTCSCGNHVAVYAYSLKEGHTSSCGCQVADIPEYRRKRGPESKHPAYNHHRKLLLRIGTPASFGRTNEMCARWRNSLENFVKDVGSPPSPNHHYERLDKKLPHGPSNWCWLQREGKSSRQRVDNRFLEFQGERLTLAEASRRTGLHASTIASRLDRLGWSQEKALMTPSLKTNLN